jgi:hypothetical protein
MMNLSDSVPHTYKLQGAYPTAAHRERLNAAASVRGAGNEVGHRLSPPSEAFTQPDTTPWSACRPGMGGLLSVMGEEEERRMMMMHRLPPSEALTHPDTTPWSACQQGGRRFLLVEEEEEEDDLEQTARVAPAPLRCASGMREQPWMSCVCFLLSAWNDTRAECRISWGLRRLTRRLYRSYKTPIRHLTSPYWRAGTPRRGTPVGRLIMFRNCHDRSHAHPPSPLTIPHAQHNIFLVYQPLSIPKFVYRTKPSHDTASSTHVLVSGRPWLSTPKFIYRTRPSGLPPRG